MDKRTILAFALIAIIILLMPTYVKWVSPPPPPKPVAAADSTEAALKTPRTAEPALTAEVIAPSPSVPAPTGTLATPTTRPPERFITVETDRLITRLSNYGARLVSVQLKPNGRYIKEPVELLHSGDAPHPATRFWTVDGPFETAALAFRIAGADSAEPVIRLTGSQQGRVIFTASLDSLRALTIAYTFNGGDYTLLYEVKGDGLAATWVRDYAEVYWQGGLAYTEADSAQDGYYSKAYTYYNGNVLEELKLNGRKEQSVGPTSGETRWGALRTKYFIAALIPDQSSATGAWMENKIESGIPSRHPINLLGVGLRLPVDRGSLATPVRLYMGPLDEDLLNRVDPSLKKTMNWGWQIIAPFSKAVLWGLKWLYRVLPNYGVCIIIFSVVVKLLVWPLTRKSYQSMAAMQLLQPKIQALREKYKSDPQRVQQETMKLYKQEKVNPMGGCLPILLQMPLLYALFIVFRTTIEFRRAHFALWIKDLSMPDVVYHLPFTIPMYGSGVAVLPILMGISTFFQSKSTTVSDPNQRFMLYFMPIFMTLIFNQFPSGLTLYYTLFNIWTLVQQKLTPPPILQSDTVY
jgi:YidC/Oxa1 family membrane protein insertase